MLRRIRWALADLAEAIASRGPAIDRILFEIVIVAVAANAFAQLGRVLARSLMN